MITVWITVNLFWSIRTFSCRFLLFIVRSISEKVDGNPITYLFTVRYCPECKRNDNEIVKAGERLKESKKKAKMASANSISNRDWGKVI